MVEGVEGLLRDKTRPPGIAPLGDDAGRQGGGADAGSAQPRGDALDGARHGKGGRHRGLLGGEDLARSRPGAAPLAQLQAIARSGICEKLHDVVGLYVSPPAHAIVLSVDEKSQIQALDRTQPGCRSSAAGCDHDPRLQAQWDDHTVCGAERARRLGDRRNMQRHRHQEFIRFLNAVEAELPPDKAVHVILDNYATHKQPKVRAWLDRHPRWTFHFVPTSCSWLNAVEGFFAKLTRRRLKNGVFHSVVDLQAAINRFIKEHNQQPRPFVWRADPDDIIAAVRRGPPNVGINPLDRNGARWMKSNALVPSSLTALPISA